MKGPKILHLDIETAPNLVYAWGLWGQDIHINQIVEPGYTLTWAAKWHGKKQVEFKSIHDDEFIERIHELIDEADICVHYNGNKFDIPHLNMAFLQADLDPPSRTFHIDLLQVVRRKFKHASNKLDWVAQQLGLQGKVQHKGMEMWRECMNVNDPNHTKSLKEMKRYNIQDVHLLEQVYNRLLPWISNHPNVAQWMNDNELRCRNCGSDDLRFKGTEHTNAQSYERFKCSNCGAPLRGRIGMKDKRKQLTA